MTERLRHVPRRTALFYGGLGALVLAAGGLAAVSIVGTGSSSAAGVQRTATVTRGSVQSSVAGSGNISTAQSQSVGFTTSGTLTSVRVAVGDRVVKGQVLATIDSTDAATSLAAARASLQTARSTLANDEAGGTASQRAQNRSQLDAAQIQLASARQALSDDEATLAAAQAKLAADERLDCIAPSTGGSGSASGATASQTSRATTPSSGGTRTTQALTAATAPTVSTGSASGSMPTSMTLTGTITPGNAATSYWFQYGTTPGYGSRTPGVTVPAGTSAVTVGQTVSGLEQDTTYLYRLVARNPAGTRHGAALTFTTPASACSADRTALTSAQRALAAQRLAVRQQEQSVTAAQAAIESAVDPATVAQDRVQVREDQVAVANAVQTLRATTLRAPISGTVTAVNGAVGDTVGSGSGAGAGTGSSSSTGASNAGGAGGGSSSAAASSSSASSSSGLVTIENMKKLQVVAGFAEADAVKIKAGQPAAVTLSALSSVEMAGTVTAIAPTPTVVSNVVTYDVTVALGTPPSTVKNGMTAEVTVYVSRRSNVLLVPSAAITTVGPTSTVTVLENGEQHVQTVTTGLVGASTTEILSGLRAGQAVVEPTVTVNASTTSNTPFGGGGGRFFGGGGLGGGLGGGPGG